MSKRGVIVIAILAGMLGAVPVQAALRVLTLAGYQFFKSPSARLATGTWTLTDVVDITGPAGDAAIANNSPSVGTQSVTDPYSGQPTTGVAVTIAGTSGKTIDWSVAFLPAYNGTDLSEF